MASAKKMTSTKKLKQLIKEVPDGKRDIAVRVYNELEFMQSTLEVLKVQIAEEGATAMFRQGSQEFLREHPALKAYNTTIQRYNLLTKQLIDLLPKDSPKEVNDDLMDFIKE